MSEERDPLFEEAARLTVKEQAGSTSLLGRRLRIGYMRACRLLEALEVAGVVGPGHGAGTREVLIKTDGGLLEHLKAQGIRKRTIIVPELMSTLPNRPGWYKTNLDILYFNGREWRNGFQGSKRSGVQWWEKVDVVDL